MEAPDEDDEANYKYLANITIPAVFVTLSTGKALKDMLKADQAVYVTMDWTDALPKKQRVGGKGGGVDRRCFYAHFFDGCTLSIHPLLKGSCVRAVPLLPLSPSVFGRGRNVAT